MIQMNRNVLKEEIQWLLEAISEQYEVIRGYEEKIPRIELDIIQENIRKLYDKINLLQKTGDPLTYFEHKTVDIIPEALRTPVVKNEPVRETVHPKEEIASKE